MDDKQLSNRYLPEHEFTEAIEAPLEKRLIKQVMWFVVGSVFLVLLWSLFADIEEIAKAKDKLFLWVTSRSFKASQEEHWHRF